MCLSLGTAQPHEAGGSAFMTPHKHILSLQDTRISITNYLTDIREIWLALFTVHRYYFHAGNSHFFSNCVRWKHLNTAQVSPSWVPPNKYLRLCWTWAHKDWLHLRSNLQQVGKTTVLIKLNSLFWMWTHNGYLHYLLKLEVTPEKNKNLTTPFCYMSMQKNEVTI